MPQKEDFFCRASSFFYCKYYKSFFVLQAFISLLKFLYFFTHLPSIIKMLNEQAWNLFLEFPFKEKKIGQEQEVQLETFKLVCITFPEVFLLIRMISRRSF